MLKPPGPDWLIILRSAVHYRQVTLALFLLGILGFGLLLSGFILIELKREEVRERAELLGEDRLYVSGRVLDFAKEPMELDWLGARLGANLPKGTYLGFVARPITEMGDGSVHHVSPVFLSSQRVPLVRGRKPSALESAWGVRDILIGSSTFPSQAQRSTHSQGRVIGGLLYREVGIIDETAEEWLRIRQQFSIGAEPLLCTDSKLLGGNFNFRMAFSVRNLEIDLDCPDRLRDAIIAEVGPSMEMKVEFPLESLLIWEKETAIHRLLLVVSAILAFTLCGGISLSIIAVMLSIRIREIGIRAAMGEPSSEIVRSILVEIMLVLSSSLVAAVVPVCFICLAYGSTMGTLLMVLGKAIPQMAVGLAIIAVFTHLIIRHFVRCADPITILRSS